MPAEPNRVLIVEDDAGLAELMRDGLAQEGILCDVVGCGADCLAWLGQHHVDLLIVDYSLPDVTGEELINRLQAPGESIPFIVTTGHGDEERAVRLMKLGALDYLVKDARLLGALPAAVIRALKEIATQNRLAAAESALRESEQRYRHLLMSVTDYLYSIRIEEGQPIATSHGPGCVTVTGYTPADFAANPSLWLTMVPPEERAAVVAHARAATQGAVVAPIEHRIVRRDGSTGWVHSTMVPRRDADGRLIACDGIINDITERKHVEMALRRSEERFRQLVESVPNIAVQGYNRDRRVVFWNAASTALYGYSEEEALGRRLEDLIIPPEMRQAVIDAVAGFVDRDEPIPAGELTLRRKDGTPVCVFSSHVKIERSSGEPEMHCIDIDLTARKEAERALAESHDFHLRMLSHAPALIWRSGPDGACDWFNETWLAFTGRTMAHEVGDGWLAGVHPDDTDVCAAVYHAAFTARHAFDMEYRLRRHDGEYRWVSDNGIPFTTPSGQFGGFIGYCFDVTERRRADERIREQAALLDVTHDAIMVTTLDRIVTYWNRAAELTYGIPATEACGQNYEQLVYREIPANFLDSWREVQTKGEWQGYRQHQTRSGRLIETRMRCTMVRDAHGKPKSVLVVVSDITESKQMEAQFLRAQRLESLGALSAGVAHDLNNVLTPILMAVDLLRPLAQENKDRDVLQLLSDSARRGSDIVQQLLIFGRGSDSPRAPLSVNAVVKDVGRMMRETFPKNVLLSVQSSSDLWMVEADPTQVHQVILNLCVNARDAMPLGGRLTLTAENVHVNEPIADSHGVPGRGSYVRIQVKDAGTGISPAHLDKIFDPFFTTKPIGQGTGLGLATVLGIVRSHGGFITVQSRPGLGTVFDIYLPAAVSATLTESDLERPALNGKGECVLIVEDEESIRTILERLLVSHNYEVVVAVDGAEAMAIYARSAASIKLVITDVMMPVMDGTQTIRALRRLKPELPVVAISGLPSHRAELERSFGPRLWFLPKPFMVEHALRIVREALDQAQAPKGSAAPNPSFADR